jgi:trimeric autotransporter adhesin
VISRMASYMRAYRERTAAAAAAAAASAAAVAAADSGLGAPSLAASEWEHVSPRGEPPDAAHECLLRHAVLQSGAELPDFTGEPDVAAMSGVAAAAAAADEAGVSPAAIPAAIAKPSSASEDRPLHSHIPASEGTVFPAVLSAAAGSAASGATFNLSTLSSPGFEGQQGRADPGTAGTVADGAADKPPQSNASAMSVEAVPEPPLESVEVEPPTSRTGQLAFETSAAKAVAAKSHGTPNETGGPDSPVHLAVQVASTDEALPVASSDMVTEHAASGVAGAAVGLEVPVSFSARCASVAPMAPAATTAQVASVTPGLPINAMSTVTPAASTSLVASGMLFGAAASSVHPVAPQIPVYASPGGEEMAVCPAADCGRTVRCRNLFEHVSSKTCKGGFALSGAQLSAIKAIAKKARTKHHAARRTLQVHDHVTLSMPSLYTTSATAGVTTSIATTSAAGTTGAPLAVEMAPTAAAVTLGVSASTPFSHGAVAAPATSGYPTPSPAVAAAVAAAAAAAVAASIPVQVSGVDHNPGSSLLLSPLVAERYHDHHVGSHSDAVLMPESTVGETCEASGTGKIDAQVVTASDTARRETAVAGMDIPAAIPNRSASQSAMRSQHVLDLAIRDIGNLMARTVTRGHSDPERQELQAIIIGGVVRYRLTALVLCARKPASEDLARSLLLERGEPPVQDGVFWSVVEFIERARNNELAKIICNPDGAYEKSVD